MLTGAPLSRCAHSSPPKPAPTMTTRWSAAGRVCSVVIGSASRGLKCLRTFHRYVVLGALASKSGACLKLTNRAIRKPYRSHGRQRKIPSKIFSWQTNPCPCLERPGRKTPQSCITTTNPQKPTFGENDETDPIRYKTKPDMADRNAELIAGVFA